MSPFFKLVKPTWPLVILPKKKGKKKSHPFIRNRETPTGFCHWDEKKKQAKPSHSALSNREPFKSSDNERDGGRQGGGVREKGRHKKRERAMERCKMGRITNERGAERGP